MEQTLLLGTSEGTSPISTMGSPFRPPAQRLYARMVEATLQPQERDTSTLRLQCPFIYEGEDADLVLLSLLELLILQPLQ